MAKEFRDFIGDFVDYDAKSIAADLRNFMRICVMLDIRNPFKHKKKLIMEKQKSSSLHLDMRSW